MKAFVLIIALVLIVITVVLTQIFGFAIKKEVDILVIGTLITNISLAYYISIYLSKRNQELRSQKDLILESMRRFLGCLFAEKETLDKLADFQNSLHEDNQARLPMDLKKLYEEKEILIADLKRQIIRTKNERHIWISLIDILEKPKYKTSINRIADTSEEISKLYFSQNWFDFNHISDLESWRKWIDKSENLYTDIIRLTAKIMYEINAL